MEEHKTSLSHLSSNEIKEAILFMISTNREFQDVNFANSTNKAREIGRYMMNLTNKGDLNEIVEKIEAAGIVKYDTEQIKILWLRLYNENGNTPVSTSTKAKHYGIITQYLGFEKVANFSPDVDIPELYVEFKNGRIFSNLKELIISTRRKLEYFKSVEIQKLPLNEQITAYKKDINEKLDFKLKNASKFIDEFIDYSEKKIKYALDGKSYNCISVENEHANIFIGEDNCKNELFKYLMENLVVTPKTKVSILYHYFIKKNYFSPNLTQELYIDFVKKYFSIEISKVFQTNHKIKNILKETVPNLEIHFKAKD